MHGATLHSLAGAPKIQGSILLCSLSQALSSRAALRLDPQYTSITSQFKRTRQRLSSDLQSKSAEASVFPEHMAGRGWCLVPSVGPQLDDGSLHTRPSFREEFPQARTTRSREF